MIGSVVALVPRTWSGGHPSLVSRGPFSKRSLFLASLRVAFLVAFFFSAFSPALASLAFLWAFLASALACAVRFEAVTFCF